MKVTDIFKGIEPTGFFILDSHQEAMSEQDAQYADSDFIGYAYNTHKYNQLKPGAAFLYRRPARLSIDKKFHIYGGGIIESIEALNDNGDVIAKVKNGFMINDYITQGDPFIENFIWKTRDKPGPGWKGFWVNYGMNKIRSEDFWNLVNNLECTEVVMPEDKKSTISNEKWSSFFDFAFANNEFSRLFRKSKTLNRSYYDLFFDSKEIHLVARNTINQKSLEIYIEDNIELYDFIIKHLDILSKEINENIDLYYEAVRDDLKHRKLIIYYEEDLEQNFNEWLVNNSLKFVKIIHKLERKFVNKLDFQILIEDDAINQSIANLNKFPDSFEYTEELLKAPEKIVKQGMTTYKRDRQKTINAIVHANYQCEVDSIHPTFLRKKSDHPYTEAHHLIPLKYQMEFEYSLDVEENIVSLCSNCHNEIHYGKNAFIIIEKLYNGRKELLRRKNIGISLEKLLSFYGY